MRMAQLPRQHFGFLHHCDSPLGPRHGLIVFIQKRGGWATHEWSHSLPDFLFQRSGALGWAGGPLLRGWSWKIWRHGRLRKVVNWHQTSWKPQGQLAKKAACQPRLCSYWLSVSGVPSAQELYTRGYFSRMMSGAPSCNAASRVHRYTLQLVHSYDHPEKEKACAGGCSKSNCPFSWNNHRRTSTAKFQERAWSKASSEAELSGRQFGHLAVSAMELPYLRVVPSPPTQWSLSTTATWSSSQRWAVVAFPCAGTAGRCFYSNASFTANDCINCNVYNVV